MHAIRKHHKLNIPFFGIAKGTFNFLMNEIKNEEKFLNELINEKTQIHFQKAQTIKVSSKTQELGYAVNDLILGTSIVGYHTFQIDTEDKTLEKIQVKGTGLCISTDLGSTAYSYNLGNPALPLDNELLIISGIVCNKYINDIVKIQKINIKIKSHREPCNIFLDGIKQNTRLEENDEIFLEKGKGINIGLISTKNFKEKRRSISNRHRNFS